MSSKSKRKGGHRGGALVRAGPQTITASTSYTGPLPPARQFDDYERTLPGAGDRIIKMAESAQAHAREVDLEVLKLQRVEIDNAKSARARGTAAAWTLGVGSLVLAAFCAQHGLGAAGVAAALAAPVINQISAAVLRWKRERERGEGGDADPNIEH